MNTETTSKSSLVIFNLQGLNTRIRPGSTFHREMLNLLNTCAMEGSTCLAFLEASSPNLAQVTYNNFGCCPLTSTKFDFVLNGGFPQLMEFCGKVFHDHEVTFITDDPYVALKVQVLEQDIKVVLVASYVKDDQRSTKLYKVLELMGVSICDELSNCIFAPWVQQAA